MLSIAASPLSSRITSIAYHGLTHEVDIDVLLARVSGLPHSIKNVLLVVRPPSNHYDAQLQIRPNSQLARKIERWLLESNRFRFGLNLYLFFQVYTE